MDYLVLITEEIRAAQRAKENPAQTPLYLELLYLTLDLAWNGKHSALLEGLRGFVHRSWWQRVWVVQETVAAHHATLICGDKTASYSNFDALMDTYIVDNSDVISHVHPFEAVVLHCGLCDSTFRRNFSMDPSWTTIFLHLSRRLQATDPRHKIFAIRGLGRRINSLLPIPITPRLQPRFLPKSPMQFWITSSHSIFLLLRAGRKAESIVHLG